MPQITLARPYNVAPDNALCLEFANTLDWRMGGVTSETLASYLNLLKWAHSRAVVSDADLECLSEEAERHPVLAESVLTRAISLREAIARIFAATARGEKPGHAASPGDLALLNAELRPAMEQIVLVCRDGDVSLSCADENGSIPPLDRMLHLIALSAAETLTSPELERVRQCTDGEGNGCGFYFIDVSRNRSRRWCSMESCGNRAKARRHYRRERTAAIDDDVRG